MKNLICMAAISFLALTTSAQDPTRKPSPYHETLALWVGNWTYEIEYKTTPVNPSGGKLTGKMTGRLILNGFGGEYMFVENGPSRETQTLEVVSYDPVAKNYPSNGICDDGTIFQGSFTMNGRVATWEGTIVMNGRRMKAKTTDAVAADGMSFTRKDEVRLDGKTWVHVSTLKATKHL